MNRLKHLEGIKEHRQATAEYLRSVHKLLIKYHSRVKTKIEESFLEQMRRLVV